MNHFHSSPAIYFCYTADNINECTKLRQCVQDVYLYLQRQLSGPVLVDGDENFFNKEYFYCAQSFASVQNIYIECQ
jgi:hypothetical protein